MRRRGREEREGGREGGERGWGGGGEEGNGSLGLKIGPAKH